MNCPAFLKTFAFMQTLNTWFGFRCAPKMNAFIEFSAGGDFNDQKLTIGQADNCTIDFVSLFRIL